MKKYNENSKGITLVVLVITVIILLILAGVSILALTQNGLFEKAELAKEKTESKQINENKILEDYEKILDEHINGDRENSNSDEWIFLKKSYLHDDNIKYTLENNDKFSNYKSIAIIISTGDAGGKEAFVNSCIVGLNVFISSSSIQSWCDANRRGLCRYISDTEFNLWTVNPSCPIYLYGIK